MDDKIAKFLRVDQAGEIGAVRIYQGQLAVLKGRAAVELVEHMAKQEHHHLATFDRLIEERNTRPTLLGPLWHVAGFALGAATAMLGERAAMACTAAVEEVIDDTTVACVWFNKARLMRASFKIATLKPASVT